MNLLWESESFNVKLQGKSLNSSASAGYTYIHIFKCVSVTIKDEHQYFYINGTFYLKYTTLLHILLFYMAIWHVCNVKRHIF